MATTIKSLGVVSQELNLRILNGTANLTQCGTSYHTNCLNKHQRIFDKLIPNNETRRELAFPKLISELRTAASQGKVRWEFHIYINF